MYTLGKFLQAVGLVLPLIGLAWAFQGEGQTTDGGRGLAMTELSILAGGVVLFFLGTKILQRAGG